MHIRGKMNLKVYNFVGQLNLKESVNKIISSDLLITIDSGINNFTNLLEMPTVSYWGPTSPDEQLVFFPSNHNKIIYSNVKCSPCVHKTLTTPCKGNNLCMKIHFNSINQEKFDKWIIK